MGIKFPAIIITENVIQTQICIAFASLSQDKLIALKLEFKALKIAHLPSASSSHLVYAIDLAISIRIFVLNPTEKLVRAITLVLCFKRKAVGIILIKTLYMF